jgi:DNA repair exonuclease SbcCD nuclease subunit
MKICILNDTHCGTRNSSEIFLNNADDFYRETLFPYLLEHNIKHIVHLGDYFDNRKFINFKALNRNRHSFLDKLREYGITMDIIPGNHDVFYKNTNDLNSLKELLGHYMNEVNIVMKPTVMDFDGFKFGLLPWITPENKDESMDFIANCKCDWLGAHLELGGFDMMRGIQNHGGMDHKIFSRFERVLSGHYHTKSTQDNITYLGTQLELFWSDAHDPKFFHILDTATRELTPVQNNHTVFKKIVYNDTETDYNNYNVSECDNKFVKIVVITKKDLYTFDRFVDRIQDRPIYELKIAENFDEFLGTNVDTGDISIEDTGELLASYIDATDTVLDKEKLKTKMSNLLIEAQALEIA